MIYVMATIELNDGVRDEFLQMQRELLPLVRAEAGCIEYTPTAEVPLTDPAKATPRDGHVFMHEKWESLPALQAHLTAPHMQDFRNKVRTMIKNVKVEVFESL